MQTRYERDAYQFLSFYRFLSYALAVMFTQVPQQLAVPMMSLLQMYVILGILGAYTLLRVFSPLRWRERGLMTYIILISDFLLCMVLLIFTNGLNSIFLLYSLTPVMSAALFFEEKIALSLASAASIFLSVVHLTLGRFSESISGIMQEYNLTLLIVYVLFSFVCATVPYRINLNIRRRIEREAIIEERRRIGREIHDGVAQTLSYLNLKTKLVSDAISSQKVEQAITGLHDIRKIVQDTYEDVRESIEQLSAEVRHFALIPALANYTKKFSDQSHIQVQFSAPKVFPPLSPVAELQLLRVTQEALTNVRRHAEATRVRVSLENTKQTVEVVIADDGKGFILPDANESSNYHGLSMMKERTEGLGGILTVSTAPGKGTEVRVSLPIEKVRF